MATIPLYALGKSSANITHYSLQHLHRNSFNFFLNSMFQLLNHMWWFSSEHFRFQVAPQKKITGWHIRRSGRPSDIPIFGDNMIRKQVPHSSHGLLHLLVFLWTKTRSSNKMGQEWHRNYVTSRYLDIGWAATSPDLSEYKIFLWTIGNLNCSLLHHNMRFRSWNIEFRKKSNEFLWRWCKE